MGLGVASTRGTATASACSRRPASGRSDRDRSADGGGDILNGVQGDLPRQHRSRLTRLAQFGQAAWFFGNLYEGLVGMPQLLADAGAARDRGLLNVGSPVRYFAPVAPLAVGASAFDLISRWRSNEDGDRHLVAVTGTTITIAVGISVYLIRVVNIALLTHNGPLPPARRRQLVRTWQRLNTVRLVCLAIALAITERGRRRSANMRPRSIRT
jgi:Domain of unknown function (DUF1772)